VKRCCVLKMSLVKSEVLQHNQAYSRGKQSHDDQCRQHGFYNKLAVGMKNDRKPVFGVVLNHKF
jgi:hypothetical protein